MDGERRVLDLSLARNSFADLSPEMLRSEIALRDSMSVIKKVSVNKVFVVIKEINSFYRHFAVSLVSNVSA